MDLELTEDQRMIQESVRRYAAEKLAPNAYAWDRDCRIPRDVFEGLAELGLMGMHVAADEGGAELDLITGCIAIEELARQDGAVGLSVAVHNAMVLAHLAGADSETKAAWMAPLLAGEVTGAFLSDIEVTASGSDWTVRGRVQHVPRAADADVLVIRGPHTFVVPVGAKGVTITPIDNPLGMRGTRAAIVELEDVKVSPVGPASSKMNTADNVALGAVAVGIGRGALEEARAYALERKQFKKPIAELQAIQWMIADSAVELDAARMLVHRAAHLVDRDADAVQASAEARLFASESAVRAAMKAIQIFGGNGFVREFPVERYLRDAKVLVTFDGTIDRQREVVADALLAGVM